MAVIRFHGGFTIGNCWIVGALPAMPIIGRSVWPGAGGATPYTAVSGRVAEATYRKPVSGSNAPPSQFAPPDPGKVSVPLSPRALSTIDGGVYTGPNRKPSIAPSAMSFT